MMDVFCPRCGEPVDPDYFHDVAEENGTSYRQVSRDFQSRGCEALGEPRCERAPDSLRAEVSAAMFDLMGDDVDGVASMMDDFEYMGLL